jgi:hypothetical protein
MLWVFLLIFLLAGCGGRDSENYATSSENAPGVMVERASSVLYDAYPEEMEYYDMDNWAVANESPKIIQNARVDMQTERFDDVSENLRNIATDVGGFVEYAEMNDYSHHKNQRSRNFYITLRVPRERFDEVLRQVESLATVRSSTQSAEDVTAQYYDLAGRLETKKIEEERVLDMIGRAETIEDMLALEKRLGQIRTDIERFTTQMIGIDRLAAFSSIHVALTEVTNETLIFAPEGLGERMGQAFSSSLNGTLLFFQNFIIFLAGALIPLVFIGVIIFFVYKIVWKKKKQ